MNSGIYVIENIVNGKKYIGQTINLKRRLYDHKRCLNKGTQEMREQGIRVKDIAKELGFARTTISKWTRNLLQSS